MKLLKTLPPDSEEKTGRVAVSNLVSEQGRHASQWISMNLSIELELRESGNGVNASQMKIFQSYYTIGLPVKVHVNDRRKLLGKVGIEHGMLTKHLVNHFIAVIYCSFRDGVMIRRILFKGISGPS